MKYAFVTMMMAALFCGSVHAETSATTATAAVPAKLQEMNFITDARPAADAKFYVYLSSASWCGPCRAIMPRVVQQYPAIKAAGGEVILLCFDRSPEAGRAYLQKYNANFPTLMADFRNAGSIGLPGLSAPRGIPNAIFVTPDGKVMNNGHGATLLNWKAITGK